MHSSAATTTVPPPLFDYSDDWILYKDDSIIVANKPSGLLSVPGRGPDKQECLISHLQIHFPDALVVHRLDMDTSGIMLFARNPQAHKDLSRQFQDRLTHKSYRALCVGKPTQTSGNVRLPMRCDWERRPLQMIDCVHGKYAETHWQLLQQYPDFFEVELTPVTGRSHQLRLHMKALGHPILGDNLYADPYSLKLMPRLMLHAQALHFTHPVSLQAMSISCPADFAAFIEERSKNMA